MLLKRELIKMFLLLMIAIVFLPMKRYLPIYPTFLENTEIPAIKGQFGENQLETVLNQLYPTGEILNTTGTPASCDFRVNRQDLPTILFETKNYDRNVTIDEVKKFIRDIDQQKCHGIFLSPT